MGKLIVAIVVALIGYGIGRALASISAASRQPSRGLEIGSRCARWGGIGIALLIVFFSMFISVSTGYVGIVALFGHVQPLPLYSGLHVLAPWYDVTEMSTQILKHEAKYDAASMDIQAVHAVVAINYSLRPESAPDVFRRIGLKYEASIIDPAAAEVLKANTALHAANDILLQRPKIKADVQSGLTTWLAKYGIDVREVSIKDIRFDKDFEHAVEQKQIAQQLAQQRKYEVEQATQVALSAVATSKGIGDSKQAEATGLASALKVRGQAEAEYNRQVAASLTAPLIQQRYLDRWDGKLPVYMLGGGGGTLLQIPAPAAH